MVPQAFDVQPIIGECAEIWGAPTLGDHSFEASLSHRLEESMTRADNVVAVTNGLAVSNRCRLG
jgi:hypothetical protein